MSEWPRPSEVRASERADALDTNWDTAVSAIHIRRQLRARAGIRIPVVRQNQGLQLTVPALIELHNADSAWIPNQFWRGRVSVVTAFRWVRGGSQTFDLAAALEHESDHSTTPSSTRGFVHQNSAALAVKYTRRAGAVWITIALRPRLHLFSCNRSPETCGPSSRVRWISGDAAFEWQADVVLDLPIAELSETSVHVFAGASASWMSGRGASLLTERRVVSSLGIALDAPTGVVQMLVDAWAGSDVGIFRGTQSGAQLGLGLKWSPR